MSFVVIIPARYQSSRFPGKPLAMIDGMTMIERVYQQSKVSGAKRVVVATDDERIASEVARFGGEVCMTRDDHESGTERLAEVVDKLALEPEQIVVNVQGDEPFIPPENISQVAFNLIENNTAVMSTLSVAIDDLDEVLNPNAVKVVTDSKGNALYFSRSTIPYDRERFLNKTPEQIKSFGDFYQRHVGIYAYSAGFIKEYIDMPVSPLEKIESLEQLRVLWHGLTIHVEEAKVAPPAGIDTPEDLQNALARTKQ
ncbi:MAG: 3-deoxy-manno-octulosonate cytidylyltransferase [Alteromonadaceae bacterium]|nr:3-deoxy-manno-octulosonate cytidylyltransferase [Alteromonadaceae bacterium]